MRKIFILFLALTAATALWASNVITYTASSKLPETTSTGSYNGLHVNAFNVAITSHEFADSIGTITFAGEVTSIGDYAFYNCQKLTSITMGHSVISIGDYAFYYCKTLTSITIPDSVTSIGKNAFYDCRKLTSITIPNSMTSIGNQAFDGCDSLSSVIWNAENCSLASTSSSPFGKQVTSFIFGDSVQVIPAGLCCRMQKLTSIAIPNSVTSIGSKAFYDCRALTSVTIPNGVTSIGNQAFYSCRALTSVTIPNGVTSIGDSTFYNCYALASVSISNAVNRIGKRAFFKCFALTSITIPNSVTSIGDSAFYSCSSLQLITIPQSVTSIGNKAFENCTSICSVTWNAKNCSLPSSTYSPFGTQVKSFFLGDSVRVIPTGLCCGMSMLTSITIPNSVNSIGDSAFCNCQALTSITIPNGVSNIGESAFYDCFPTSIYCYAETPPVCGKNSFTCFKDTIYVHVGSISAYKTADIWKNFASCKSIEFIYGVVSPSNCGQIQGTGQQTSDSAIITARPNYGYRFFQWSDSNIENPRTITFTQDTTFEAQFVKDNFSITTSVNDTNAGKACGDTTVLYLDTVTIYAVANYGYHFMDWNSKITDSVYHFVVDGNCNYQARFAPNTYKVTALADAQMGTVKGGGSYQYLDKLTIEVEPNYGYHFVQWSDGNTDNPRTFTLTQDTTFSAQFAKNYSGQCGDSLFWVYNNQTLTIAGSGSMYNEQPWVLFKDSIQYVNLPSELTSIGSGAFKDVVNLTSIIIPSPVTSIGANAFDGCRNLLNIHVYALTPPYAEVNSFANYNVYLKVPCDNLQTYQTDIVFGSFKYVTCIGADQETTDGVSVVPSDCSAAISWPSNAAASSYTIEITKEEQVFCILTFNAQGVLTNIAFAPGRGQSAQEVAAEELNGGYRFTITSLSPATTYGYDIETKDADEQTINNYTGSFTTQDGGIVTDLDNQLTDSSDDRFSKVIKDGQLFILREGKMYNAQGGEVR